MEELNRCVKCKVPKPLNEFHRKKSSKNGHRHYCKTCGNEYAKNRYAANQEFRMMKRNYGLKNNKKISLNEYNIKFAEQYGKCAICGKHQTEFKEALAIDHDHITGNIRGLICRKCNLGIGNFNDSIENLKSAISYLEKYC
jgi:hypothetical protein